MRRGWPRAGVAATVGALALAACDLGVAPTAYDLQEVADSASGDIDGDGDIDLVVATRSGWSVLENDGSGAFTVSSRTYPVRYWVSERATLSDVDGDDDLDVVLGVGDFNMIDQHQIQVALNDGSGTFASPATAVTEQFVGGELELADATGDGVLDVLAYDGPTPSCVSTPAPARAASPPRRRSSARPATATSSSATSSARTAAPTSPSPGRRSRAPPSTSAG